MNHLLLQWAESPWAHALGLALLHFLWQGTAVALLLAAALRWTPSRFSEWRHGYCLVALLSLPAMVGFTFWWHLQDSLPPVVSHGLTASGGGAEAPPLNLRQALLLGSVGLWAVGAVLFQLRLVRGFWQLRRWRTQGIQALPRDARKRFRRLLQQSGIRRPVRAVQSLLVEVPTVVGWLRPMILMPASCISGMNPHHLEALLAHELAHIRRHDFLVNLLQAMIEAVLFYHPATWWISKHLRLERELCCDDAAVKACGNALTYARALVELEGSRGASSQLLLAANGGSLMQRIRRLVEPQPKSRANAGWVAPSFLALGMSLLLPLGLFAQQDSCCKCRCHGESKKEKVVVKRMPKEGHGSFRWRTEDGGQDLLFLTEDMDGTVLNQLGERHAKIVSKDGNEVAYAWIMVGEEGDHDLLMAHTPNDLKWIEMEDKDVEVGTVPQGKVQRLRLNGRDLLLQGDNQLLVHQGDLHGAEGQLLIEMVVNAETDEEGRHNINVVPILKNLPIHIRHANELVEFDVECEVETDCEVELEVECEVEQDVDFKQDCEVEVEKTIRYLKPNTVLDLTKEGTSDFQYRVHALDRKIAGHGGEGELQGVYLLDLAEDGVHQKHVYQQKSAKPQTKLKRKVQYMDRGKVGEWKVHRSEGGEKGYFLIQVDRDQGEGKGVFIRGCDSGCQTHRAKTQVRENKVKFLRAPKMKVETKAGATKQKRKVINVHRDSGPVVYY
ncbi:MAG: hypothetical protein DWQ01_09445 [Planctomycetota bacterium]|nr:MAG: hypothetical protein DWQ01_09445 [Planctomycetota bacterium]